MLQSLKVLNLWVILQSYIQWGHNDVVEDHVFIFCNYIGFLGFCLRLSSRFVSFTWTISIKIKIWQGILNKIFDVLVYIYQSLVLRFSNWAILYYEKVCSCSLKNHRFLNWLSVKNKTQLNIRKRNISRVKCYYTLMKNF